MTPQKPTTSSTASAYIVTPEMTAATERYFTFWETQRNSLTKLDSSPGALVGALFPTIALVEEASAIAAMSDDEIRMIPPVILTRSTRIAHFGEEYDRYAPGDISVEILGDSTAYRIIDLCVGDKTVITALDKLCEYRRAQSTLSKVDINKARKAWLEQSRAFAHIFWDWHEKQEQHKANTAQSVIEENEDYLVAMSDIFHAVHCGISTPLDWQTPENDFPYKDIGNYQLSLGNYSQSGLYNRETDSHYASEIKKFDPEHSLSTRYAHGVWLKAHNAGTLGPNESVKLPIARILEVEGIQKDKDRRDYTSDQKRRVLEKMRRSACVHIRGTRMLPNGEKRDVLGTYLDIIISLRKEDGEYTPYEITISPGLAVRQFYSEHPEIGYFFSALAKLNFNRPGVDRLAFMLGNYLIYQYQVRRSTRNYDQPFFIGTLLSGAQIEIESNPKNHGRFITSIDGDLEPGEGAFERLKAIGLVKEWRYKDGDYEDFQRLKYGRFAAWQEKCRVIFDPPDIILQRSKVCQDALEGHVKRAERTKAKRERRKAKALAEKSQASS
jgi:hypothetical protein